MAEPLERLSEVVRRRPVSRRFNDKRKSEIVERVIRFYRNDIQDRKDDQEKRLELTAKIEGWTSDDTDNSPWEGSSDISLPDIRSAVLQTEDNLVNAVMSARPIVAAKAHEKGGVEKERTLSNLLDVQFFEEQQGEVNIHELADTFTKDGSFVAFVPYVREDRPVTEVIRHGPIPEDVGPKTYFLTLLESRFQRANSHQRDSFWSWRVPKDGRIYDVEFYTKEPDGDDPDLPENIEMVIRYTDRVYDGPKVIVKDYEDVLTPARSANLQPRSPSNPEGATHVIVVDTPTVEEVRGLIRSSWYNLTAKGDLDKIETVPVTKQEEPEKDQKDILQGERKGRLVDDDAGNLNKSGSGHNTVTRLTCYDAYVFEDGKPAEDMIWWVLLEPEILVKAAPLTEMYPTTQGERPMRPFGESSYLPVKGRRQGESLPAIMEGLHDYTKQLWDQMMDAGTIQTMPFGFYRPSSSLNPEIVSIAPGELFPLANPAQDIFFPNLQNTAMAFGLNMIQATTQLQEKLTLQGDLQAGRVPQGKSSALRTVGGIQTILEQGEARPERVLRRFFMGLTQIFELIHRLNKHFLPTEKKFRVAGFLEPSEDPYQAITVEELRANSYDFIFTANIQNSSLNARSQALQATGAVAANPLALQLGIATPDTIYRLYRDLIRTSGVNPDLYLTPPTPGANRPKLTAQAALRLIMSNQIPDGVPMEPAQVHLETLQALLETRIKLDSGEPGKALNLITASQGVLLEQYMRNVAEIAKAEQAQQAQLTAAADAQKGQQGPPSLGLATAAPPPGEPTQLSGGNELLDESLPTAGGGANAG